MTILSSVDPASHHCHQLQLLCPFPSQPTSHTRACRRITRTPRVAQFGSRSCGLSAVPQRELQGNTWLATPHPRASEGISCRYTARHRARPSHLPCCHPPRASHAATKIAHPAASHFRCPTSASCSKGYQVVLAIGSCPAPVDQPLLGLPKPAGATAIAHRPPAQPHGARNGAGRHTRPLPTATSGSDRTAAPPAARC